MLNLDSPWKIVALVATIALLRVIYTVWKTALARAFLLELFDSGLIAFALVFFLVRPFVVQAFYIPSPSMEPTLKVYDRILVNKFIYRLGEPRRKDIAVFRAPEQAMTAGHQKDGQKDYIKRIVGLSGDVLEIRKYEGVFVNGRRLDEPYIGPDQVPNYDWGPYKVPDGRVFVLGDNRNDSNDSHLWGFLDRQRILGKAMVIFWPIARISLAR